MSTSKTGKHGHAKVHLVAIDIFTGKKLEELCPSTHNMDVPNVSRTEYQFSYIDDEFLNLIKPDGSEKNDVKVPEGELGDKIREYEDAGVDIRKSYPVPSACLACTLADVSNSRHHHCRHGRGVRHLRQGGPQGLNAQWESVGGSKSSLLFLFHFPVFVPPYIAHPIERRDKFSGKFAWVVRCRGLHGGGWFSWF